MNYIDMIEKIAKDRSRDPQVEDLMSYKDDLNKYKKSPYPYNDYVLQKMKIEMDENKNEDPKYRFHISSSGYDKKDKNIEDRRIKKLRSYISDPIRARKKEEDLPEYDKRVGSHINKYVKADLNRYGKAGALAGLSLGGLYGYARHGRTDSSDSLPAKLFIGSVGALRGAAWPGIPFAAVGAVAAGTKDTKRENKLQSKIYESMTPEERQILIDERNRIFDEHLRGISDEEHTF